MKLIDLHWEWMEIGKLPTNGLCTSIPEEYKEMFKCFYPTYLTALGLSSIAWAGDYMGLHSDISDYGITRQTIVLFICAMAGEI